jgi:hypothetical protein
MKQTENYGFEKPDIKEFFKLETWKNNMDKIDETIKKRETEQKITNEEIKKIKNVQFTQADERKNIESKETLPVLFGKIAKWFADLKTVAFSGNYNDLSNKPTIPAVVNNNTTTEAGYALDARQANPNVDGSLAKQVSTLNSGLKKYYTQTEVDNIIEKNKVKSIVIEFKGITTNENKAFFPKYTYWGYVGGKTTEIDNLIAQGHTILGGFICGGPHNDASIAGNVSDNIGVIVGSATYYNVPYSFYVFSQAYQTIRIKVCVLYI